MPPRPRASTWLPGPARIVAMLALAAVAATEGIAPPARSGETPGLEGDDRFRLALGHVIFRRTWVSAPASTTSSDGLGPLYNARACAHCHPAAGRGQPGSDRDLPSALVLRLSVPPRTPGEQSLISKRLVNALPEPTYGLQLQPLAIQGHRSEGRVVVSYEEIAFELGDGEIVRLRRPAYRLAGLGYGPPREDLMTSPRVAPQLIGLGLLELVPEGQILEREGRATGGVAGVANRVWSLEQGRVVLGRFGWKAGAPTVRQQVAEAFALDLGLSTSLLDQPAGDCTEAQVWCRQTSNGRSAHHGGHEVGDVLLDLVTYYAANALPPVRPPMPAGGVREGEGLFHAAGCAACHRPSFQTSATAGPAQLRAHAIFPYTDLLVHDMGEGLADGRPEGLADGRMWRTAPLWGAGRAQTPDGRETFLHDGRARSIEEAVLWHGGAAATARDAFARLRATERRALVAFVKSL